jgi:hypothetical protein
MLHRLTDALYDSTFLVVVQLAIVCTCNRWTQPFVSILEISVINCTYIDGVGYLNENTCEI